MRKKYLNTSFACRSLLVFALSFLSSAVQAAGHEGASSAAHATDTSSSQLQEPEWIYFTRPGDTIWEICIKYVSLPGCWQKLDKYNGIEFPIRMPPGLPIAIPLSWLKEPPLLATVQFVRGDVVYRVNELDRWRDLSAGRSLPLGVLIKSNAGNAKLAFSDGSVLVLEKGSTIRLDQLSLTGPEGAAHTSVLLKQGTAKSLVIPGKKQTRFQIRTPAAVAAVRGTDFQVGYDSDSQMMRGEVFKGEIQVANPVAAVNVPQGYGILASDDGPSEPQKLLPASAEFRHSGYQSLPLSLEWATVEGAQAYQLRIHADDDPNQYLHTAVITNNNYALEAFAAGCYGLKVSALAANGLEGQALSAQICIREQIAAPIFKEPELVFAPNEPINVSWIPVPEAVSYKVEISEQADFSTALQSYAVEQSQLELTLEESETYYLRVSAIDAKGITSAHSEQLILNPHSYWFAYPTLLGILVAIIIL